MDFPDAADPVERLSQKPKRQITFATVTWGLIACIVGVFLFPMMAGVRIQSASGYVDALNTDDGPIPTLPPEAREPLQGMGVNIWFVPEQTFVTTDQLSAQEAYRAYKPDGSLVYTISYTEQGFNDYLYYWYLQLVQPHLPDLTNPRVEIHPGAVMVYAYAPMGETQVYMGFLYELDESGTQFDFRGIAIDGQLISVAEGSILDEQGIFVELLVNRALREMVLIDLSGSQLGISRIYLAEERVEVLALSK